MKSNQKDRSSMQDESCRCHINPPCSKCTDTFECEKCGDIVDAEEWCEGMCNDCFDAL
jgi:hypothetical protein